MKRINKIILTILLIFTLISCKEADGISSGFIEINAVDGITGNITIGNNIKTCTIIYGVDADITTGTSITFQSGRTDAVELTLINYKAESTTGSAIDFGSAGNFDHKLYIGGNCIVTSTIGSCIHVPEGVSLTIDKTVGYITDEEAKLTVTGGRFAAGIGGNLGESSGNIVINGGTVTAIGGQFAAGIGGGDEGSGGIITINNGVISVTGGSYGAAIGGGWTGSGGTININNGTVTAVASYGGAAIGGGKADYNNSPGKGDGGIINISGGNVEATTNINKGGGAAIGGGHEGSAGIINISGGTIQASSCLGAAIGSGYDGAYGTDDTIFISGGTITAASGGVGIGGRYDKNGVTITITNGIITATSDGGGAGIGGSGSNINISGGTITATGGVYAAAIGGSQGESSGIITISGGTVIATGGVQASGIGGGADGAAENITINGGTVTAFSKFGGAAIGGGIDGDNGIITINDGTVIATSLMYGAGIGGGNNGNGGTIIINGGTITASCGDGISYEDIGGRGGAGIGGGNRASVNAISINGGNVTASGAYFGAGIGGGDGSSGGIINISNGYIMAVGGACGAGIGGGRGGAVETVTISGGTVNATGGRSAAGIGGGYLGAGGDVIINNSPVVIATGDYDYDLGAEHIGRGFIWDLSESEMLLVSGTLKDGSGNDLSYLRFSATDVLGEKFANINIAIKGNNAEYLTDNNGLLWMFVPYIESKEYSCTFYRTGYAAVKKELALKSVSHDISAIMLLDDTAPVIRISPETKKSARVISNDYGVFGSFYMVPKVDTDYKSKTVLEMVPEVITVDIEIPATYALMDASASENGEYQIYAVDSAGNLSLPVNVSLPFNISRNIDNKITTSENGNVSIQTTPTLNSSTKTAGIKIDTNILDNAFSASFKNTTGINIIGIDLPKLSGALNYETTLPANELVGNTGKAIEIRTEYATVILQGNMLSSEKANNHKTATLSIKTADTSKLPANVLSKIGDRPVIELSLMLDGKLVPWNNPDASVTVSIPYSPTAEELKNHEHLVIWYIDSSGNIMTVPSGRYNTSTGCVTFTTNHFSYYAIAFVQKTFSDISEYEWAKNQIEVLASKEIINGVSENNFYPSANITRADYLVLLIKTLGLTTDFENNFSDVSKENYYYEAVGIARELGITTGSGNNLFNPNEYITRQDMMVLTARALEKFKGFDNLSEYNELDKFSDKSEISEYALDSMSALISEELIVGSGETIKPLSNTTRAEAAVFLYRLYNKY